MQATMISTSLPAAGPVMLQRRAVAQSGPRTTQHLQQAPLRHLHLRGQQQPTRQQQQQQPSRIAAAAATPVNSLVTTGSADLEELEQRTIPLSDLLAMAQQGQLQVAAPEGVLQHSRKMASRMVVPVLQGKPTPPLTLVLAPPRAAGVQASVLGGGGQRLSSLLAFVSGSASAGGQAWPSAPVELDSTDDAFIRWNGKTFEQLPEATKQQVRGYGVTCRIVRPKQAAAAAGGVTSSTA